MTADELDELIERELTAGAAMAPPDGFTDRVMRAVATPARRPARFDWLSSAVASGALVGTGALLWFELGDTPAAAVLMAAGLVWMWLDDPFSAGMRIRLTPW